MGRSIPACAGEPRSLRPSSLSIKGSIPACAGEPRQGCSGTDPGARSIPACAGEPSVQVCWLHAHGGVYPRVCGGTGLCRARRLSPACAPHEMPRRSPIQTAAVYPRVCGGTAIARRWAREDVYNGSIPACAGEPRSASDAPEMFLRQGSIPACAGEPRAGVLAL